MKNWLRKSIKAKRLEMTAEEVRIKSSLAQQNFLSSKIYQDAECIMLYMPIGNETHTETVISRAFNDGKYVVFPVTNPKTGEITAYFANQDTCFKKGAFSVNEPISMQEALPSQIDVVLVPGIAFDRKGNRIGFGKGCYDRFLSNISALKIGFCYDLQICNEFESDAYDIKMDFLVTETEIIKC